MKNLIFIIIGIFVCVLSQCKRSEHVSNAVPDRNLVRSTKDAYIVESIINDISSSDTTSADSMNVNSHDNVAPIFIRTFYKEYLLGIKNDFADSVRKTYCTSELIEKLVNRKLDYDPFLNAQDFNDNLLKTLNIKKSKDLQGYYVVSYVDEYSNKNVYIVISLAEYKGDYKISDIVISLDSGK